ncbi:MAG: DUF4230 domain-containing protein [Bacteroidia bacterium]
MFIISSILRIIDSPVFLRFGVPAVLLLAIFGGYFWGKPAKAKVKPFALLERIQYVQELHLVSYRYEEMILLGVPPKFDKKRDEIADLTKIRTQLADSLRSDSAKEVLLIQDIAFANEDFFTWTRRQDSLRKVVKSIKKKRRKSEAFKLWKAAQDSINAAERAGKDAVKRHKDLQKLLVQTVKSLEKMDKQIARLEKSNNKQERLDKAEALVITPVEVSAYVDLRQARFIFSDGGKAARLETMRDSLDNDDYILSPDYVEALKTADSVSIDEEFEKTLSYRIDSVSLLPNRRLNVYLPYPKINEPIVDLDTTRTVNLARSLTPSIYRNYFEVFEALAEEVREIKKDVKEKAITTGIIREAQEVAETYVRSFVSSLPQYDAYEINVTFTDPETIDRKETSARVGD